MNTRFTTAELHLPPTRSMRGAASSGTLRMQRGAPNGASRGITKLVVASISTRVGADSSNTIDSRVDERSREVNSARRTVNSTRQDGELCKRLKRLGTLPCQWLIGLIPRTLQAQHYSKK